MADNLVCLAISDCPEADVFRVGTVSDVRLEIGEVEERPAGHVVPEVCVVFATNVREEIFGVVLFQRLQAYVLSGNNLVLALRP